MPITRELTQDELDALQDQGRDISDYKGKKFTLYTDDEVKQQTPTPPQKVSQLSTIGRTLKSQLGGDILGGGAAIGVGELLAGLGAAPFSAGMSLPLSIAGLTGIAGAGLLGSYAGEKTQEAIQGDEETQKQLQELQEAQEQHPVTSAITSIISSALASG